MATYEEIQQSRSLARPVRLYNFSGSNFGPYAYCDGETAITRGGVVYQPWPIKSTDFEFNGTLDKSDISITLALGSGIENEFIGFPPDNTINVTIYEGDLNPGITPGTYAVVWRGRLVAPEYPETYEINFICIPISSLLMKAGLRRNWQLTCPHALYGTGEFSCRANKANATVTKTVSFLSGSTVTFSTALGAPLDFRGGMIQWTYDTFKVGIRTITGVSGNGLQISVRGTLRGIVVGGSLSVSKGCNRTSENCTRIHNNVPNFGGQEFIPLKDPLSSTPGFY